MLEFFSSPQFFFGLAGLLGLALIVNEWRYKHRTVQSGPNRPKRTRKPAQASRPVENVELPSFGPRPTPVKKKRR